jgi:hypothetical protein
VAAHTRGVRRQPARTDVERRTVPVIPPRVGHSTARGRPRTEPRPDIPRRIDRISPAVEHHTTKLAALTARGLPRTSRRVRVPARVPPLPHAESVPHNAGATRNTPRGTPHSSGAIAHRACGTRPAQSRASTVISRFGCPRYRPGCANPPPGAR